MSVLIAASAIRTCLGDGAQTFAKMCAGRSGVSDLRDLDGPRLNVLRGYHIDPGRAGSGFRASGWLTACISDALLQARLELVAQRVVAIVGTGLRELREVERMSEDGVAMATERLQFGEAVRTAAPSVAETITLSNACSASGHALALAQDLLELDEADVVIAAGIDAMTSSMLAMIGRVGEQPADQLRPFDVARCGALLGEGAAAMVLVRDDHDAGRPLARLLSTGVTCDAYHQTAVDAGGIERAMLDAYDRARRSPDDVDVVIAHATGTAVNDPLESDLIRGMFAGAPAQPKVAAIKGAIGHTSGAAALMSVDTALRCLQTGDVPPIVGLRQPIPEAEDLDLATELSRPASLRLVQVDAFGFGGVNAVTLLEAAA